MNSVVIIPNRGEVLALRSNPADSFLRKQHIKQYYIMHKEFINKHVIVRADRAGVFFGTLAEMEGNEVKLTNCRRIWKWSGAASLSELAVNGVTNPGDCKFSVPVQSIVVLGVIEIIPCEQKAIESINAVKEWRMSR